jgi:DNA-binding response OmpR family regulator
LELPFILVVEDDQLIQGFVEETLRDGGFDTAIATSGEEALTLLKGRTGKYRALVTDINLQGKTDGWKWLSTPERSSQISPLSI